jgi:hypothetical protein
MRQLILASVLLLASVSAHAGDIKGLGLAAGDTTVAADTQPLPPVSAPEAPKQQASAPARPEPSRQEAARPQVSRPQVSSQQARLLEAEHFGSDEAKARRIAARYGISW